MPQLLIPLKPSGVKIGFADEFSKGSKVRRQGGMVEAGKYILVTVPLVGNSGGQVGEKVGKKSSERAEDGTVEE